MKIIVAAFALAIATPAAAQPAAQPTDHGQHQQGQHHQGQGQHHQGQGAPGEGQRHDCPCCRPGVDGQRPACCERMHQQQSGRHH